jgi:simple sugar transport system permease protein
MSSATIPTGRQRLSRYLAQLLFFVGVSVVLGSLAIAWIGKNPFEVYTALIRQGFFTRRGLMIMLQRGTPLILTSAAATMAFRTGAINMGIAGQFMVGGAAAAMAGYAFAGFPRVIHLPLVLTCSALGGAAAGFVPAFFKRVSGVNEVITGMIANLMMPHLLNGLVGGVSFLRTARAGASRAGIPASAQFRQFVEITGGEWGTATHAHTGVFFAVGVALVLAWWIKHTALGFELRMTRSSYTVAEFAGISAGRGFYLGMMLSGALAALGGATEVLGVWRSYRLGTLVVGEKGLVLSLIGGQDFVGSMIAALVYGGLESGTLNVVWTTAAPRPIIDILVQMMVLLAAVPSMRALLAGADPADAEYLGGRYTTTWR